MTTATKKYDIVALSAVSLDIQIKANDALLERERLQKGVSNLISPQKLEELIKGQQPAKSTGGPGTNVATGIAVHGGAAAMIGKIANDNNGTYFAKRAVANGIDYTPVVSGDPALASTCVLVMTTPDKERSFGFISGAAEYLAPEDIDHALITNTKITYLDSYLWNREIGRDAVQHAAIETKKAGGKVAIAINDFNMVERNRAEMLALAKSHGDILLGDQREFMTLFGTKTFDETVKAAQKLGCIASITAGKDGAYIVEPNTVTHIPCNKVSTIVDTNGAGDQFAAGFLYGLTQGKTPADAGKQGALWASEIIQHMGAEPQKHKSAETQAPAAKAAHKGPRP